MHAINRPDKREVIASPEVFEAAAVDPSGLRDIHAQVGAIVPRVRRDFELHDFLPLQIFADALLFLENRLPCRDGIREDLPAVTRGI